jgi:hypothetical protein
MWLIWGKLVDSGFLLGLYLAQMEAFGILGFLGEI